MIFHFKNARLRRLRASRPGSLRVRIRFVFPVCHSFPIVVSQDSIHVQLTTGPSQNRTCAVNASGSPPTPTYTAVRCDDAQESPGIRRCVRWMSESPRVMARCLPFTGITRLRSTRLGFGLQRYYAAFRLPESHLPPLPLQLLGHTRSLMIGLHDSAKNLRVSLVTLMTQCVARMGLRLRVSSEHSPLTRPEMLPSSMHRPWAGSNRNHDFGAQYRSGRVATPYLSSSLPLCIRFNAGLRREPPYTYAANARYRASWLASYPGGIPTR